MVRPVFERLIHIPGPNPIIKSGGPGDWDENCIEACNVVKDGHTYYFYYHGVPDDNEKWGPGSYRMGVATATHPLGPWRKYGQAPLLDVGPEGGWDSGFVACATVLKEQENTYYMFYSGLAGERQGTLPQSIGLATADSPLGPWKKHEKNPIIEDFGYVGGVMKVDGKYYMYSLWPIDFDSPDQGPFCLATADRPEGPWRRYENNPVLTAGPWGSWDDGGYSEAGVLYHEGVFHAFYGGTKWEKLESIGYAYSFDGRNFHKHPANPVAMRERCPGTSAFAEVHALFEPPLFYLYNTERYIDDPETEHLGVQILATSTPFRIDMPVMMMDSLKAGARTGLGDCPPIGTENVTSLALTTGGSYCDTASGALRVKVFPSYDGINYDTEPVTCLDLAVHPGQHGRKTVEVDPVVRFAKLTLENLDERETIHDVRVIATLGCA